MIGPAKLEKLKNVLTRKVESAQSSPKSWGYSGVPNKGGATLNSFISEKKTSPEKDTTKPTEEEKE